MNELLYYNDGKEKMYSHEVFSKALEDQFDLSLQGYGSTKEEAYEEFVTKLDEYIEKVQSFRQSITLPDKVNADCFGYPLKESN